MKSKLMLLMVLLLFYAANVCAQGTVEVALSPKEMSEGVHTSFTVFIPEAQPKLVENEWKRFINDRYFFDFATTGTVQTVEKAFIGISNIFSQEKKSFKKTALKVEKKGNELIVRNVIHEEVTQNHIDVYAQIHGAEDGAYLNSFFKYSDSIFIDQSNILEDALQSLKLYLREFGVETYRKVVEQQIAEEEKALRKEEQALKQLESKNNSLNKSIDRKETNIDDYNYDIAMHENELDRLSLRNKTLKDSVSRVRKKSVQYDLLKESIKDQSKERKKTSKKIKGLKNKIKREQRKIVEANSDILANKREQELQQEAIRLQENRILDFEAKLESIR